jgi:zinc/manganese transport system permease protein
MSAAEVLSLLALPFAASIVFVLIHAYLGVHVLRRKIVFADLALAQLSALGASVAFANGYDVTSIAGFAYALAFTAIGAALLTFTRTLSRTMSQEAVVGIVYVVATAATILVVDRSPLGAEHVKKILIGSVLTVNGEDVAKFATLYAAIGLLHWLIRRPLLALSSDSPAPSRSRASVWGWDFVFFLSFGVVVTSSVTTAGVLLVFSLLIVPAVIGSVFSSRLGVVLVISWAAGIAACAAGLAGSYVFDLPTGAALVTALAIALVLAGGVKAFVVVDPERRRARVSALARHTIAGASLCVLASSAWLIVNPSGDQPLLALLERAVGLGPPTFLSRGEGEIYQIAVRDIGRFQREADRLDAMEKAARYQRAEPLPDDEIRRIASYQQNYNEMTRGERFVRDVLQAKARARERWMIGVPAAIVALLGLALSLRWRRANDGTGTVQRASANAFAR